jgi:hypothetical protein
MLLLGTALTESGDMHYLHQLGNGPALGVYQMEPTTHEDIYDNYLKYKKELPGANDLSGLANYWKTYYNTKLGKGVPNTFVRHLREAL